VRNPGLQTDLEIYSVSELTSRIKQLVSNRFRDVLVEGEVSNAKLYPSGHLYFSLKDDHAVLKAVIFNFTGRYSEHLIKDGVAVICAGRVDVYEKRGEYQLLVNAIEVKGLGLLQLKFQVLKEKLFKEGLFDLAVKKALPLLPRRIGIVTSPAGAAIRDVLKVISRKFENMPVLIYPVKVQGDDAAGEIVQGIRHFNESGEVDVIIVGRGGGSLEDLAPFNEEMVARAIYASDIPVVSGVGHEIDFTIADFVADVRAPTPTAAAELVVKDKMELLDGITAMRNALEQGIRNRLEKSRFMLYQDFMELKEKKDIFLNYRMYVDDLLSSLAHGFTLYLRDKRGVVDTLGQRIQDLNPENILRRGYSITTQKETGEIVTEAGQVTVNEALLVRVHRGRLEVEVRGRRT
jgi:exodeoxyribonuclease VII large subunit